MDDFNKEKVADGRKTQASAKNANKSAENAQAGVHDVAPRAHTAEHKTQRKPSKYVAAVMAPNPTTFENASHPGLQIIAVGSGDGKNYVDTQVPNRGAVTVAMQREILHLKREVARKRPAEN